MAFDEIYSPHGIVPTDTVYALAVLGCRPSCEHPGALFCMRGDELEVLEVIPPTQYESSVMYKLRLKRGTGHFYTTFKYITKMCHFSSNYDDYQRHWDREKAREYSGY